MEIKKEEKRFVYIQGHPWFTKEIYVYTTSNDADIIDDPDALDPQKDTTKGSLDKENDYLYQPTESVQVPTWFLEYLLDVLEKSKLTHVKYNPDFKDKSIKSYKEYTLSDFIDSWF